MDNRSVHNVRIKCLWVDITAQVGAHWADLFTDLELMHELDVNNVHHIWLLHWNHHKIQICDGPNHSPADMFGFNMEFMANGYLKN